MKPARCGARGALALFTLAGAIGLWPGGACAQAWLPDQGSLAASIDYNDTFYKYHFLPNGVEFDAGHTRTFTTAFGVAYSPTDRLSFVATLPYVSAEYHGNFPHPTIVDDGSYHGTLTDLRVEAHVQLLDGAFALAPYLALLTPIKDYETLGHAAPGRGLTEGWVGTYVGRSLEPWLPRTYMQARLNYAFVERVARVKHDRINIDVELGYFMTPRWSARVLAFWQDTDGGIPVPVPDTDPLFVHHDQLAADRFLNVGAGTAFQLTGRTSVHAVYSFALHGQNAHKVEHSLSLGFSQQLGRR